MGEEGQEGQEAEHKEEEEIWWRRYWSTAFIDFFRLNPTPYCTGRLRHVNERRLTAMYFSSLKYLPSSWSKASFEILKLRW